MRVTSLLILFSAVAGVRGHWYHFHPSSTAASSLSASDRSDSCTGTSAELDTQQCAAWQTIYDTLGGSSWTQVGPEIRSDPCSSLSLIRCSDDGTSLTELHLGNRGLTGQLPADAFGQLPDLTYLMLAHNSLSGPLPTSLNYSQFHGCGYGQLGDECCYFTALVSGVYDTSNETGITNAWDCPLPPDAELLCHAACAASFSEAAAATATSSSGLSGSSAGKAPVLVSPRAGGLHLSRRLADTVKRFEAHQAHQNKRGGSRPGHEVGEESEGSSSGGGGGAASGDGTEGDCQVCVPASADEYPQCDVNASLIWDHISAAYCTDDYLVVWANARPNHQVHLAEIPKPPGSGMETGDYPVRLWNTQSYTYRIPLNPVVAEAKTNYSGAGAVAMTLNGVSMYPILEPGEEAIDLSKLWEQGHDPSINMKLDQQLDSCNEHAGRGFDIHYHADPVCMYQDVEKDNGADASPIIGYAADGFALYGKYDEGGTLPEGLDRCNGHDHGDERGYHYHTSTRFPYTIVCWTGVVNGSDTFQPGGQPGEQQWAIENERPRNDWEELLPCCDSTAAASSRLLHHSTPQTATKQQIAHLPPHLVKQLPHLEVVGESYATRESGRVAGGVSTKDDEDAARANSAPWMFQYSPNPSARIRGSNVKLPAGPKTSRGTGITGGGDGGRGEKKKKNGLGREKANDAACTGNSSALVESDCVAWQDLFDATGGATSWISCGELRLDPCACLTAQGQVVCGSDGTHVTALALQANGLVGSLPDSLAAMTHLTVLNVAGNYRSLPHTDGLGGLLPEGLLWEQYVGCGLEGNNFDCPLPKAALRYCSDGQPIGCTDAGGGES